MPHIEYFLRDKLLKLHQRKAELEKEITVVPSIELSHRLDLVNYHIECTENRINDKFTDPLAYLEGRKIETVKTYVHA